MNCLHEYEGDCDEGGTAYCAICGEPAECPGCDRCDPEELSQEDWMDEWEPTSDDFMDGVEP